MQAKSSGYFIMAVELAWSHVTCEYVVIGRLDGYKTSV